MVRSRLSREGETPTAVTATATRPPAPAAIAQPPSARPIPTPGFLSSTQAGNLSIKQGDLPAALEKFRLAVADNPGSPEANNGLGLVLTRLGRLQEAATYFDRAIEANGSRWAYLFNRGNAFAALAQWDRAIADYRRAQNLFPGDYAIAFNLALALHKSGDEAAAIPAYQRAIELAPSEPSFQLAIGITYEKLGRAADAALSYRRYLALSPDAADAERVKQRIVALMGTPQGGTAAAAGAPAAPASKASTPAPVAPAPGAARRP